MTKPSIKASGERVRNLEKCKHCGKSIEHTNDGWEHVGTETFSCYRDSLDFIAEPEALHEPK